MCIYFEFICRTNHPECAFTLVHPPAPPATPCTPCNPCNGLYPLQPLQPLCSDSVQNSPNPSTRPKFSPSHAAMLRSPQFLNPAP